MGARPIAYLADNHYFWGMNALLRPIALLTLLYPSVALPQIREAYRPLAAMLSTRPEREVTEGNRVELIPCGPVLFSRMQEDIMDAEETVHAAYFIFQGDETGFLIRSAFQLKALDGLDVQYIAEDFTQKARFIHPMERAGVQVRHHPFFPLMRRNHQKYLLLDGTVGYAGGVNISHDNLFKWEDTAVRLEGPVVAKMEKVHAHMWKRKGGKASERVIQTPASREDGVAVQCVDEDPTEKSRLNLRAYIWALDHAQTYFYAKSPYLKPPEELIRALVNAAGRGVEVRLVIPAFKDAPSRVILPFERAVFEDLVRGGVHLHLRTDRFDHSKMFACDDYLSAVGSINLDALSLVHNFENNLYFYDEAVSVEIRRNIEADWEKSPELTLEQLEAFPVVEKVLRGPLRAVGMLF